MNWHEYSLDDTISKTTETAILWKTEKGLVEISKGSLAVAIKRDDETKGYVFHGQGKLLLDAIVETYEGAIGKPIEKEITEPFLMLGHMEEKLDAANQEDVEKMGYTNQQEVLTKAKESFDRFLGKRRLFSHHDSDVNHGHIFAFPAENGKFDLLVAHDSEIVYKAREMTFVSHGGRSVLKSPSDAVCVANGKMVIIKHCCDHSVITHEDKCA